MKLTVNTHLENLQHNAADILALLEHKTVLFYGEMGTGKTTLITELLNKLGCPDTVNSPTFSIVNEYTLTNDKAYHFDFYRMQSIDEAFAIGVDAYLETPHWKFIEWPQLILPLLSEKKSEIHISLTSENERLITIKNN